MSVCLSVCHNFPLSLRLPVLSRLSPYFPVYCVFRFYILLLHHSFHFPFALHFGSYSTFSSTRRPARKVTFTAAVVFVISNIQYICNAVPFVPCRDRGAVAVGLHSVSISVLDGGEWWTASFAQKSASTCWARGWVGPEPVSTCLDMMKSVASTGIRTRVRPARSVVAMPTTLRRPKLYK
jgi:hypothetical protein